MSLTARMNQSPSENGTSDDGFVTLSYKKEKKPKSDEQSPYASKWQNDARSRPSSDSRTGYQGSNPRPRESRDQRDSRDTRGGRGSGGRSNCDDWRRREVVQSNPNPRAYKQTVKPSAGRRRIIDATSTEELSAILKDIITCYAENNDKTELQEAFYGAFVQIENATVKIGKDLVVRVEYSRDTGGRFVQIDGIVYPVSVNVVEQSNKRFAKSTAEGSIFAIETSVNIIEIDGGLYAIDTADGTDISSIKEGVSAGTIKRHDGKEKQSYVILPSTHVGGGIVLVDCDLTTDKKMKKGLLIEKAISHHLSEVFEDQRNFEELRCISEGDGYCANHWFFWADYIKEKCHIPGFRETRTLERKQDLMVILREAGFDPTKLSSKKQENTFDSFRVACSKGVIPVDEIGSYMEMCYQVPLGDRSAELITRSVLTIVSPRNYHKFTAKFCWVTLLNPRIVAMEITRLCFKLASNNHDGKGFWSYVHEVVELCRTMLQTGPYISADEIDKERRRQIPISDFFKEISWNGADVINRFNSMLGEVAMTFMTEKTDIEYANMSYCLESRGAVVGECQDNRIQLRFMNECIDSGKIQQFIYCLSHSRYFDRSVIAKLLSESSDPNDKTKQIKSFVPSVDLRQKISIGDLIVDENKWTIEVHAQINGFVEPIIKTMFGILSTSQTIDYLAKFVDGEKIGETVVLDIMSKIKHDISFDQGKTVKPKIDRAGMSNSAKITVPAVTLSIRRKGAEIFNGQIVSFVKNVRVGGNKEMDIQSNFVTEGTNCMDQQWSKIGQLVKDQLSVVNASDLVTSRANASSLASMSTKMPTKMSSFDSVNFASVDGDGGDGSNDSSADSIEFDEIEYDCSLIDNIGTSVKRFKEIGTDLHETSPIDYSDLVEEFTDGIMAKALKSNPDVRGRVLCENIIVCSIDQISILSDHLVIVMIAVIDKAVTKGYMNVQDMQEANVRLQKARSNIGDDFGVPMTNKILDCFNAHVSSIVPIELVSKVAKSESSDNLNSGNSTQSGSVEKKPKDSYPGKYNKHKKSSSKK